MGISEKSKSQPDKFREAAREAETDDREEVFDAALRKLAKASPSKDDNAKGSVRTKPD